MESVFLTMSERFGLPSEALAYIQEHGTLASAPQVSPSVRALFATALEIAPEQHLRMQAAFQSAVENAVSKTINLPADASPATIAEIYREAYRLGLKGITVYRYGSIKEQVLQLGVDEPFYEKEHAVTCDPSQCKL